MERRDKLALRIGGAALIGLALAGCDGGSTPDHLAIPGADRGRGERLVAAYGCGACHVIPKIAGAIGQVGPPLDGWGGRSVVAGILANTPEGLVAWLRDPPAHNPRTAMPNMRLSEAEARDVAAFLFGLPAAGNRVRPPDTGLESDRVPRPVALPGRGPFVSGAGPR